MQAQAMYKSTKGINSTLAAAVCFATLHRTHAARGLKHLPLPDPESKFPSLLPLKLPPPAGTKQTANPAS